MTLEFFVFLVFFLVCGFITSTVARDRGRDPVVWYCVGSLFGILGIIAAFIVPKVEASRVD